MSSESSKSGTARGGRSPPFLRVLWESGGTPPAGGRGCAEPHTPSGTPVRIGVGARDGHAVLEFQDEGLGMTPDQAERVFDRFHRADTSRARAGGGGAGLGLAIVGSLVRAHGGRVEVRTAPDRGATFRVLLPLNSGVRTEKWP
ncbi:ATP-binding protein [Streptomyces hirsutus]|uniref:ATP-binding protein n=1 Tax=Streptomyces hirsutus TaxID=35620 RepID=UPI00099E2386